MPPLQHLEILEVFEVETGGEVKKSREKNPQQPIQTKRNIEKYGLPVLSKCFSPFTILLIFSGKPESLAGLLSAKVSPCGLIFHYHVKPFPTHCEISFPCKAVASCSAEFHICPLKHDDAEELTSIRLGLYILIYRSKAGIKKQEAPISAAACYLLSLLPGESPAHGAGNLPWL